MKNTIRSAIVVVISILTVLSFVSCNKNNTEEKKDIWESAVYTEDTELGTGSKTLNLTVKVGEHSVKFTVKTDKENVGEALFENGLIDGDMGDYGLYIKKVNGITADYDIDQSYWAFYVNGEYAMSGVDTTPITEGDTYALEYTK